MNLPFEVSSFDIVWTEHVKMNIEDKYQFYVEIARVLKLCKLLLYHDIFKCKHESLHYPVPWADDESINLLVTLEEAKSRASQEWFEQLIEKL